MMILCKEMGNSMYFEKMEPLLEDLENKEIEIAGGAVVGMVLTTVNSLIKYIVNLTIGKEKYIDVQDEVKDILNEANNLKLDTLKVIDKDKEVLENILSAYKLRKDDEEKYIMICKEAVDFCMKVLDYAYRTLELSNRISKVGNKMLASDFKICKYYAYASIQSAIVNVDINLKSLDDSEYKEKIVNKYNIILENANKILQV